VASLSSLEALELAAVPHRHVEEVGPPIPHRHVRIFHLPCGHLVLYDGKVDCDLVTVDVSGVHFVPLGHVPLVRHVHQTPQDLFHLLHLRLQILLRDGARPAGSVPAERVAGSLSRPVPPASRARKSARQSAQSPYQTSR